MGEIKELGSGNLGVGEFGRPNRVRASYDLDTERKDDYDEVAAHEITLRREQRGDEIKDALRPKSMV